ncbi:hypothetical protein MELA_02724 [Candidatus Methylomirabilis lanthanidiphila]|uniref:Uncharacterized protein n=1 Tax=Candidatus Methylomirabilis lanthanidiphila TaxID=2211376 RepID=A0A564ZM93_9BACT|nr:hypothetical protein [Candidatus Methylomirabilis lanthanidiphila]VUZ86323.1 hypothetical protein MELA_02724 [Candidatus Methylomirabilis lanthanidiphila]
MKMKTFDCVEIQHRGAEQLTKKIDRLTVQQELAFWAERSHELKQRQATAKAHEAHRQSRP